MLVKANKKATFPYDLQRVWEVVESTSKCKIIIFFCRTRILAF